MMRRPHGTPGTEAGITPTQVEQQPADIPHRGIVAQIKVDFGAVELPDSGSILQKYPGKEKTSALDGKSVHGRRPGFPDQVARDAHERATDNSRETKTANPIERCHLSATQFLAPREMFGPIANSQKQRLSS